MKRTVPLLITAIAGFVLIVSVFIPATKGWGEDAAVWFDILAAIAFILGGGNLLKMHLKKVSDRVRGWGYSLVTLVTFLTMLGVGLLKIGSPPAPNQEFYGETFVEVPLALLPASQSAIVDGRIPRKPDAAPLPASVRAQLLEDTSAGKVMFRGWMRGNQRDDLAAFKDELEWKCLVENLFDASQPEATLKGKLSYYADHEALGFKGVMDDEQRDALLAMSSEPAWASAVQQLYDRSRVSVSVAVGAKPASVFIPPSLAERVTYDAAAETLTAQGPLSARERDALAIEFQFPIATPLNDDARAALRSEIESRGSALNVEQAAVFHKTLDGVWTAEQLATVLNVAGKGKEQDKTACEMLAERAAGVREIEPTKPEAAEVVLNEAQVATIRAVAGGEAMTSDALAARLTSEGPFTDAQREVLRAFLLKQPTIGERNKVLAFALLRAGPLNQAQRDWLLAPYREQVAWRQKIGEVFLAAHTVKYPWSGAYRAQGNPFWWLYEHAFKPLTATMFALLAFYVASAAFRAFRAKNIEAILLLATAFIILLGRTFAGVWMTSWIPADGPFAGLRVENLTVTIMSVFNTAGNRAIMIGIALGIVATSLKVLLGVDRSYLGKE
jgi:hypothetical protein